MIPFARTRTTWLLVAIFAVAMAWVESACVYYLRMMVDRLEPYQANPLPIAGRLGNVELIREAATLVMLAAVGVLAGRTWRTRLAYAAIAFGVWDISYYVWLKAMYGWPNTLLDWDVLFLLPLPWWGPVIAPVCIAALMIVWGTLALAPASARSHRQTISPLWAAALGILLALYVFMEEALHALPFGPDAVRTALPTTFNWSIFIPACALMTAPIAAMLRDVIQWPPQRQRREIASSAGG